MDTCSQDHNINDTFSSFDFICDPWYSMFDAGIFLFVCMGNV